MRGFFKKAISWVLICLLVNVPVASTVFADTTAQDYALYVKGNLGISGGSIIADGNTVVKGTVSGIGWDKRVSNGLMYAGSVPEYENGQKWYKQSIDDMKYLAKGPYEAAFNGAQPNYNIDLKEFPTLTKKGNLAESTTVNITQSGWYSKFNVTTSGDTHVSITANEGQTIEIRADEFYLSNTLTINGSGNVIFYVDKFQSSGVPKLNLNGDPKKVMVYLSGENTAYFTNTYGSFNVYAPKGTMNFDGSNINIKGNIYTKGNLILGSTCDITGFVYAANSDVTMSGNAKIYGKLVAKNVNISGSAQVRKGDVDDLTGGIADDITNPGSNPDPTPVGSDPDFDISKKIDKSTYTEGETGHIVYTITPKGSVQQASRGTADIVIAIDMSPSMKADKLNKATKALTDFIDNIEEQGKGDKISLMTFGYKVNYQSNFTTDYDYIKKEIKKLQNKDLLEGTNFDDALDKARTLVKSGANANKYVVFVSDGNPNYFTSTQKISKYINNSYSEYESGTYYYTNWPYDTPEAYSEAKAQAEAMKTDNIVLFTLGMGKSNEIDAQYLSELSAATGGKSYIAAIPDDLAVNFEELTNEISQTRISNITITEGLPQGVSLAPGTNAIRNSDGSISIAVEDIIFEAGNGTPAGVSVPLDVVFNNRGTYNLNNSAVRYTSWNGTSSTKQLNSLQVTVTGASTPPDITVSKEADKTNVMEQEAVTMKYKLQPTGTFSGTAARTPMDVVIVIDKSYSMKMEENLGTKKLTPWYYYDEGRVYTKNGVNYMLYDGVEYIINDKKLNNAKTAAKSFVDSIQQAGLSDRIAIVDFNKYSHIQTNLTSNYQTVKNAIDNIYPENLSSSQSGTNYEAGLREAGNILAGSTKAKYIIFLSDGMPNYYISGSSYINNGTVGGRSYTDAKDEVKSIATAGITLHTVGVGSNDDVDMDFMEELAKLGGGKAYQSSNSDDLNSIFQNISNSVLQQKLSNITIVEELPAGVEPENDQIIRDDNKIIIRLDDIVFEKDKGTPTTVEFSLKLKFPGEGTYDISPVSRVDYKDYQGNSASKNFDPVSVNVQKPDYIISNLNARLESQNSVITGIRLSWNHTEADQWEDISRFVIERSINGLSYVQVGEVSNSKDEFFDDSAVNYGAYTYIIKSIVGTKEYTGGKSKVISIVDNTPPAAPTFSATPDNNTPTNGVVNVAIIYPADAVVKEYRLEGSNQWIAYTGAIPVTDNNTTIYARCSDAAGNPSEESCYTVTNIDKEKPTAPTFSASPDANTPTNGNVSVTVIYPEDAAVKQYRIEGSNDWITYTGAIPVDTNGTVIYARCYDAAGNVSPESSYTVNNIDRTAPTAPTFSASPDANTPTNGNVSVTVIYPEDAAVKQYRIEGSEEGWITYTGAIPVDTNGTVIYARCYDAAGNVSPESSYTVNNIDRTAPDVPTFSASPDANTPTNGNVSVTVIYPEDAAVKQYRIEGSEEGWKDYTGAIPVDTNGTVIYARCYDAAGNVSPESSYTVNNIDRTAPTAPTFSASPDANTPTNGNVSVTVIYPEDTAVKQYRIEGSEEGWKDYTGAIPVDTNGTVIYARCYDAAGNVSPESSYTVNNIDRTAPDVPTFSASPDANTPTNGNVSVTVIYPEDAAVKQYRIEGSEEGWITYTGAIPVDTNGTVIYARCYDAAGNVSPESSYTVNNIDRTAPTAPTFSASPDANTPTNGNVSVTVIYPEDAAVKQYRIEGSEEGWITYTGAIPVDTNGTVIYARCYDAAGNVSPESSYTVNNIDRTAPTAPTFSASPDANTPTNGNVSVTVIYPEDAAVKQYRIEGSEEGWKDYTGAIPVDTMEQ